MRRGRTGCRSHPFHSLRYHTTRTLRPLRPSRLRWTSWRQAAAAAAVLVAAHSDNASAFASLWYASWCLGCRWEAASESPCYSLVGMIIVIPLAPHPGQYLCGRAPEPCGTRGRCEGRHRALLCGRAGAHKSQVRQGILFISNGSMPQRESSRSM
ncbi:hypothetical protein FB45DRAFT_354124 [Roridomyces roridus]|uniref:Uncharacterized protein n=1 Tax=Roridomyces roridus TaxID=1738132 RepID=A0AAD7C779_9AGAR|nr:hypothetical protein FB45DRAFT_354124 [Roridomyces roridus]